MKSLLLITSILGALLVSSVKLAPLLLEAPLEVSHDVTQASPVDVSGLVQPPPGFPRLPAAVDFASQVVPILQRRCVGCHPHAAGDESAQRHIAELAALLNEAESAGHCLRCVVDCEGVESDLRNERLAESELLARWFEEGATYPMPQPEVVDDWSAAEQQHWAYRPLQSPVIPRSDTAVWARNPIDSFVMSRFSEADVAPAPTADAATLVRRLSLAVTGLPPSPQELQHLNAAGPDYFDAYVDRLLASPAYGEHWARFWLDLVRYADTNGYEGDGPKPLSWKYRDFVIRSFNQDRPYDEFVQMQLAGDLNPQPTADSYIAVGYLRLGAWNNEPDDALVDRYQQLDDIVSTTGLVFLGMTIGCARCHDHPEEPVTAVDYARLVGCFHGLGRPTKGQLETASASATVQQLTDAAMARRRQQMLRRQAFSADAAEAASLRQEASRIDEDVRFEQAYRLVETDVSWDPTRLLLRGDPHQPAEFVKAGLPSVLADGQFCDGTLPRRQLADWLTTRGRSLTARLIVNRIWAWHFGRGLVETPSNFGLNGAPPTHPALLEWLADWFVHEAKWSLKRLHRLILTSQTYRTRVELQDQRRQQLYGSFPRSRLRAEVLQDSMLTIAGLQDRQLYGPPVSYPSREQDATDVGGSRTPSESVSQQRRAIYSLIKRNAPDPFRATFDSSNSAVSCPERRTTHTSQQALTLWNGPLIQTSATTLAEQIIREHPLNSSQQVDAAFFRIIGREPDTSERTMSTQFLDGQRQPTTSMISAVSRLCLVLFNSDAFVFLN